MGRIRKNGLTIVWWAGDHPPRHVHVYDSKDRFLGRVILEDKKPLGDWNPSKRVIETIEQLEAEGRL